MNLDRPNVHNETVIAESENHSPNETVIVTTGSDSGQHINNLVLTPEIQETHDILILS